MKTNRLTLIPTICGIVILSVSASATRKADTYKILIDGKQYDVEINGPPLGKMSGSAPINARFATCENNAGAGFFWVDTSCGAVWWANLEEAKWVYYGSPDSSHGRIGRYVPYENKGGAGLYILDTDRGTGWWTNGQHWKTMGIPTRTTKE